MSATASPEERFAAIVAALGDNPAVTPPTDIAPGKKFGTSAELRVNNKIFAMLMKERLVVKLPRQRVDALVADDGAVRLNSGNGRQLKEWACVAPNAQADWLTLAREALDFVATKG
ncbi:MAG: MmcQ/YjbR family DNA-binding protein [Chloroflexaceae bacterium]|nr:MmcQ/YjbR family DNA-binding protein [Chloroflexaceae bacterium]